MSPRTRWAIVAIAICVLVAVGMVVWLGASAEPTKPDPDSASLVTRGKSVYTLQCASCHGTNLEGQRNWREPLPNGRLPAPPHDATGHTWHHSDKQLFDMVKNGTAGMIPGYETDMPAYKDKLSDSDIWAVLSFIESAWPTDIRERQQRLNRQKQ
jgi:mono/diheme cytochrome c family protein